MYWSEFKHSHAKKKNQPIHLLINLFINWTLSYEESIILKRVFRLQKMDARYEGSDHD